MRYGAPVFDTHTPEEWIASHRRLGYGAAYFPLSAKDDPSKIDEYAQAAREAGLVIAEVGARSNPIDPNPERREQAVRYNIEQLELAERVGARCCVNISGSCHPEIWMAAHPDNLSEAAFEKIVQTVRRIIDAVNPTRTFYTLECMPWSFPDSVDSYLELIKRVDRKGFAVHLDPCNLVNCPRGLYGFSKLIQDCASRLGPYLRSVHVKDLSLKVDAANVELSEVEFGTGDIDRMALIRALSPLEVPMMLEHLPDEAAYRRAGDCFESLARQAGVALERI